MKYFKKVALTACIASALGFMSCISIGPAEYIYKAEVDDSIEHGTILLSKDIQIAGGEKIEFFPVPYSGYELDTISVVSTADGKAIKVSEDYFRMPVGDVKVSATFTPCAVTKTKPDAIGDIVLNDGRVVPFENIDNMSEKQKKTAIAVIFSVGTECSNEGRSRTLGVGLHYNNNCNWCTEDARVHGQTIDSIQTKVSGRSGNYTFSGDKDGSDNLQQISNYLARYDYDDTAPDTQWQPPVNQKYQALHFAKFYSGYKYVLEEEQPKAFSIDSMFAGDLAKALGGKGDDLYQKPNVGKNYEDGWYLPSIAELYYVWQIKDKLNTVCEVCNCRIFQGKYISASMVNTNAFAIGTLDFDNGTCNAAGKSTGAYEIIGNPKTATEHWSACAVYAF